VRIGIVTLREYLKYSRFLYGEVSSWRQYYIF